RPEAGGSVGAGGGAAGWLGSVRAPAPLRDAQALYESRDYRTARARLDEALALDAQHDAGHALRAWTDYHLGRYRAALIGFKTAARRQPTWAGLYDGIGWSRLRLDRASLARDAFRVALDRVPDFADALVGLGTAYFTLEQYEAALPMLRKALGRLEPLVGAGPPEV